MHYLFILSTLPVCSRENVSGSNSSATSTHTTINQASPPSSPKHSPLSLNSIQYHSENSETLELEMLPSPTIKGVERSRSESGDVLEVLDPRPSRRFSISLPNISSSAFSVDDRENESDKTVIFESEEGKFDDDENIVMPDITVAYKDMTDVANVGLEVLQVQSRTDLEEIPASSNIPENNIQQLPALKISGTPSCISNLPFSSSNVSIDSRIEALGSTTRIKLPPIESDHVHKIQNFAIPGLGKKESKIRHNSIFHALSKIRRPSFGGNRSRQTSGRGPTTDPESNGQSDEIEKYSSTVEDMKDSMKPDFNRVTTVDFVESFPTYRRGTIENSPSPRKKSLFPTMILPRDRDKVRTIQSAASPATSRKRHNSIFGTLGKIRKVSSVRSRAKSTAVSPSPRQIVHLHHVENAASFLQYSQTQTGDSTNYGIDYYQSTIEDPRALFPDPSNFSAGVDIFASTVGELQPDGDLDMVNNITSNVGRQSIFYDAEDGLFNRESRELLAKIERKKGKKRRTGKRLKAPATGKRYQQMMDYHKQKSKRQSLFTRLLQQSAFRKSKLHSLYHYLPSQVDLA